MDTKFGIYGFIRNVRVHYIRWLRFYYLHFVGMFSFPIDHYFHRKQINVIFDVTITSSILTKTEKAKYKNIKYTTPVLGIKCITYTLKHPILPFT